MILVNKIWLENCGTKTKASNFMHFAVVRGPEAVNFKEEYKQMHKATSKLVHPTAFSVLGDPDERENLGAELRQNFFMTGIRYGLDAFNEIKDHVAKHGVEPLT